MKTPKVVLDTNIFVSGIIYGGTPRVCIDLAREGKIQLFTSNALLLELARILNEKFEWSEWKIRDTISGLSKFIEIVSTSQIVSLINKDESDNRILEVAKEVDADYIVTGDKRHILPLRKFGKTKILGASDFVQLFAKEKN